MKMRRLKMRNRALVYLSMCKGKRVVFDPKKDRVMIALCRLFRGYLVMVTRVSDSKALRML